MVYPLKAILIILWFGCIPFGIGMYFTGRMKKNQNSFWLTMLCGYTGMFALFEVMSLPMIFLRTSFSALKYSYGIVTFVLAAVALFLYRKRLCPMTVGKRKKVFHLPWTCWVAVLLVGIQIGIYVFGMSLDLDDSFYVGTATTALETDTMFQYSAYMGNFVTKLPSRYVLSPFPIMLAFFGAAVQMNPTLIAHTVMPVFFVTLVYGVYALIGQKLFKGDVKATGMFLCLLSVIHIFSYYSVYTQGTFMLIRIWQGKAVLAALLLPLLFYMSFRVFDEKAVWADWAGLFAVMGACCLVSSMGIMLAPLMLGILTLLQAVFKKRWKNMFLAMACCLPCVLCGTVYLLIR